MKVVVGQRCNRGHAKNVWGEEAARGVRIGARQRRYVERGQTEKV